MLPPDHPLLSTQGWHDPHTVRDFKDPEVRERADEEGPPRVSKYKDQDWIYDGHHRILADRAEGRPTRVLYHH